MANIVYIGTSLDGYIASEDGSLDWLGTVPNPEGDDLGFGEFIKGIDAVVMGRLTFETLQSFDVGWHYPAPGIVLSSTLKTLPDPFQESASLTSGTPEEVVKYAENRGFKNLYIDGGTTIQRFLRAGLIDEMIITEIPILLGGGDRLFGRLDAHLKFELVETTTLLGQTVKRHYRKAG